MIGKRSKRWLRATAGLALATLLFSFPGVTLAPALAVDGVVSGTVKTTTDVPVANVTVQLHTPDGIFSTNATTNVLGAYSFNATLTNGTNYVVEVTAPTGYNRVGNSFNFVYNGTSQTANFQLTQASKTVSGTVVNTAGQKITDADLGCAPYNNPGVSSVSGRTDINGAFSMQMVGGSWFCEASVNLSEYTPQWIAEEPPVRVNFVNDSSTETNTQTFTVTPATGKVSMILQNSDGSALTSSNFVADIHISRADGVGTVRKVKQSDSSLSVYLTPGIYSLAAFHSDLAGKSFDPAATTFAMTEGGIVDLGTIRAQVDSAHLKGKVTSGSTGLGNIQLEAIREGGSERRNTNSTSDGSYDVTVGAGTWVVGIKNFNSNGQSNSTQYSQVAPVSAIVANAETATGLNIQVKTIDKTITGNVLNSSGTKLTDYVGTAYVKSSNKKAKATAPVVNGAFTIQYASADVAGSSVIVGVEAGEGSAYTGSTEAKTTISGATASKDVTVLAYDVNLSGQLALSNGGAWVTAGSDIDVEAVDENGNFVTTTANDAGAYSMKLAKGTWQIDYNVSDPDLTDGLLNRPAGQNKLTVASGATKTLNLTVLKGTNTVTGTVTDSDGNAVKSAIVNIDNRPKLEDSGTTSADKIVSATALTNVNGVYTVKVPDGSYMVTAGLTPDILSTELSPDGKNVKVSGATTATTDLKFQKADATIKGKVTTNGKKDGGGSVIAYSDTGAQASAEVASDGSYTLKVSSKDAWHVEVTDLSGKKLMESATTDIKPKAGNNTVNLVMKDSGVTVPGPVTKSCSSDQACAVSLPDGTSVSVPAFGIDESGNVTLTVTPVVDLDKTATDAPATLAYEVKATDSDGYEVKKLNKDAEVTIPYSQDEMAKNGLVESRLNPTYFNPQTQTWEESGASGLVDAKNNVATIKTDHFTKFSVTGTTKPAPVLSKVSIKSGDSKKAVIEVTGKNFKGKVSAVVGKTKASKVQVKDSKTLLVTVSTKGMKSGKATITVTNGNGRIGSTSKTLTISKNGATIK